MEWYSKQPCDKEAKFRRSHCSSHDTQEAHGMPQHWDPLLFGTFMKDCVYRPNSCKRKERSLNSLNYLKSLNLLSPRGLSIRIREGLWSCLVEQPFGGRLTLTLSTCKMDVEKHTVSFSVSCQRKTAPFTLRRGIHFDQLHTARKRHAYTVSSCQLRHCHIILNVLTAPKHAAGSSKNKITKAILSDQINANQ